MTHPERVGPYKVLSLLGEGGMGTVHLALDGEGRTVAVKVMHSHLAGGAVGHQRLRREVAAMRRVESPYVAEILDFDLEGPQPYVATRYAPGRSLRQVVTEHGPLPPAELERLGTGLAHALEAVHQAGVVHRDLTPNNVMMVDGDPVVIDLGIALVEDMTRMTDGPMGTPGYIAPEVLKGETAGPAADVFAWGAVMVFAATGRSCFGRGPTEAVAYRVVHEAADLSGVPGELAPVLEAALSKDPVQRPAARSLVEAVRRSLGLKSLREAYREATERAEHGRAEEIASRIHELAADLADRGLQAWALLDLARSARFQDAFDRAEEAYARALPAAREAGVREAEGWALDGLGVCARTRGDLDRAGRCFAEALGIAVQVGQREMHAWNLYNLGDCARRGGDLPRAVDLYEQAREAAARYGLPNIEGWAADGLGGCLRRQGDRARAERVFGEAKALALETGDLELAAWSLDNLGTCARQRGDLPAAEAAHREALELGRRIGHRVIEGWSLINLARAADDPAQAGDLYAQAHRLARQIGHSEIETAAADGLARSGRDTAE